MVRLRGVLTEASACRLAASLRCAFAADPQLLITDLGGLRGWDDSGQRQLACAAEYLAARGGQMVLNAMGAHLRRTDPRLAALEVFADVPAILAAKDAAPCPGRQPGTAGLSELAANAASYGFADAAGITMRLWRTPEGAQWLTAAVHDSNPASPVLRAPAAYGQPPQGWGLIIVTSCADAHSWYPDTSPGVPGETVWFARRLQPPRQHSAPPARP